jgi:hypothetical protein
MTSFKGKKGFVRLLLEYSLGILLILSAAHMAESLLSSPNKQLDRILLLDSANGVSDNSTLSGSSSQINMTDNSTNATVANGNFTENPSDNNTNQTGELPLANNTNVTTPENPANVTNQTELPPEQNATENITENNTNPLIPPSAINMTTSENTGNAENITYVHPSHLAKGETVKYTPTSETHCIKGTCVATLYSMQNFIQDTQGNYKHMGEIASLTYSGNILNISWNKRSILLQPYVIYNGVYTDELPQEYNFSISYTNFVDYIKFRPRIKFVDGLTEFGFKKVSWSNDEVVLNFDDLAANNFEVTQNETHISIRNLEGKVSSNEMLELDPTITLNESNSGNVGDSFTNSSDTSVNYGSNYSLIVNSYTGGGVARVFLLFNMSVIPSSATITDANLSLYMFVAPTNSRTYNAYNTSNSWTESGITQSNQPAQGTLQQGVTVYTPNNAWKSWNVTNAAVASYAQTNQNMSIMIRDNAETATTSRNATFVSKENTTDTTKRPQLVVTYTEPTPPTYSQNSTNSTLAGTLIDHRLRWQDNVGLSGYIFALCNGSNCNSTSDWTSSNQQGSTLQLVVAGTATTVSAGGYPPISWDSTTKWANVSQVQASDNSRAWATTQNNVTNYYDFSYGSSQPIVPVGSVIGGINVTVEYSRTNGTATADINISNDGGSTIAPLCALSRNSGTDTLAQCGDLHSLYGLTWTRTMVVATGQTGLDLYVKKTSASWSTTFRIDYLVLNINYTPPVTETNTSWTTYTGIGGGDYANVSLVNAIITISNYTPYASNTTYANNHRPDVEVGLWNGTAYINGSICSANATMGLELQNNTAWNCTISTTQADIITAWQTASNRKIQIRGTWLDNYGGYADEINVTQVYAHVDGWSYNLVNDSWVAFTSEMCGTAYTNCWSNATKTVNSTEGATIYWCFYVNDTSNNMNSTSCFNPFVYLTTGAATVISFTITIPGQSAITAAEGGNATADIEFNLTGGNTASNIAPCLAGTATCQTSGTPIFAFTNTGTATLNWYVYLDTALPASMTLKGDTDNNPVGAATVTTAGWLVASSIAPSGSQNAWLWTDFNGAKLSDATNRNLKNNATSS